MSESSDDLEVVTGEPVGELVSGGTSASAGCDSSAEGIGGGGGLRVTEVMHEKQRAAAE